MLQQLRLVRYKGFEDFRVALPDHSILVGPNNAGKSTVVGALRLCSFLINTAKRVTPSTGVHDATRDRHVLSFPVRLPVERFVAENVRHEFRELETRLELKMKNGSAIYVVWPVGDLPYFYFEQMPGANPIAKISIKVAKEWLPSIGTAPTLTPLSQSERILSRAHVEANFETRLASSHFRNQLLWYRDYRAGDFDELIEFLVSQTPEIDSLELDDGRDAVDLYFREQGKRVVKELVWAGDGLHIWLQLLFHIWRNRDRTTLLLDEPDVFLHPDLQRRLVRVLEAQQIPQTILASHSAEVVAEAERGAVVMIDRLRKRSVRPQAEEGLGQLGEALGSAFNLRLTKAFRSKVVLFVEGQDIKLLRRVATRIGATKLSSEQGVTVIPLGGYSQWRVAAAFAALSENFLGDAVKVCVLLDRDYRSDAQVAQVRSEIESRPSIGAHVWKRKELESYFLNPALLQRSVGTSAELMDEIASQVLQDLKVDTASSYQAERLAEGKGGTESQNTILRRSAREFEDIWSDEERRFSVLPPKLYLTGVNKLLAANGVKRAITFPGLANIVTEDELPVEMRVYLKSLEELL